MPRFIASLVAIGALLGSVTTSFAQAHFTARLTGNQILPFPGVATAATGTAFLTLTSAGLQYVITVEGLSGPIKDATIHRGPPGQVGAVLLNFTPDFLGRNTAAGLWPAGASLDPFIPDLLDGNLHFVIYTAANPFNGEIRGQIQLSAGVHLTANLQGAQENPGTGAVGTGAGSFTLTEEGLAYHIQVNNLTGAIGSASIYTGAIGVNGGATFPLAFAGTTAFGAITGLTPAQKRDLIAGNMYVNIRTAAFPAGEIRGQIQLAGGLGFSARLDGAQEVPANASPALGTATATLTSAGLLVDLTSTGLSGPITAAHIHRAPPGVVGAPVRTFSGTELISGTSFLVLWTPNDPEPLKPDLIAELMIGNLYVNVHTAAFGGGEIRGQLVLSQPGPTATATYTANLTWQQEEPPIPMPATLPIGTGNFRLLPGGLFFRITMDGLTGPITGAHFHNAPIGVGGGVVRGIVAGEFISPTTMTGMWTPADPQPLTPAMVTELMKGNLYFNVHTAANPAGESRGQIVPASGAEFEAFMFGTQETPPLGVVGAGNGSFTLTPYGLAFNITYDGLTGAATGAHFHLGTRGVAGGIVRGFTPGEFMTPNTLAGVWKPTDAQPLTPALVTELLRENIYVNIHTAANPAGEIRGQLVLSGGLPFGARLNGPQEVPPNLSPGKGTASMTLTDEGFLWRVSNNELVAGPTSAEFGQGPPGVNGPVLRPLYPGETIGAASADAVWKTTDPDALTATAIFSMFRGEVYLDINTAAFPAGEIRGQLGWPVPTVGVGPVASGGSNLQLLSSPNPSRERTTISFYLPQRAEVRLALYDVAGAQVVELVRGPRDA
ncbi:MAG TPA: CHRD domain-containing protein, partial [Candidatus Eisenbacteria bacterium]|nr:CHRD domain-containing protein [Candidatus Eisenbacteria bacterium]